MITKSGWSTKKHPTHWRFVLQITEPPDPQIAIVFGDFLFNVRSALDHVAVACAPPSTQAGRGLPSVPGEAVGPGRSKVRTYDARDNHWTPSR